VALEGRPGLEGLVHISQVSSFLRPEELRDEPEASRVAAVESFCRRGDVVWVKVIRVEPAPPPRGGWRVSLSMRAACQETGADLDAGGALAGANGAPGSGVTPGGPAAGRPPLRDDPPEVGSIHRGTVHAVKPFGVFVVIPGFRRRGLVPLQQVSAYLDVPREAGDEEKVRVLTEALGSDPEVFFKVVEVQDDGDGRGTKVACSIKNVAQHDGQDLDPHNLNYRPRGGGGARGPRGTDPDSLPAAHQLAGFAREEMALRVKGSVGSERGGGYELLLDPEDEEGGARHMHLPALASAPLTSAAREAPRTLPPMGRGTSMTQPAWMAAQGGAPAPGGSAAGANVPPRITSVEQALDVLRQYEEDGSSGGDSSDSEGHRRHHRRRRRRRSGIRREASPGGRGGESRRRKRSRRP